MAIETKYGIVVDSIPEDEPIMLFRGQDKAFVYLLSIYIFLCELIGSPEDHLRELRHKLYLIHAWQHENRDSVKVPD